ncbi:SH2 domain-containing protein 5 [Aphomia sociella]
MSARRLVLNGLTAEVRAGAPPAAGSPDSLEFYHELELYRQLLALPAPAPAPAPAPHAPPTPAPGTRRARTPDPQPSTKHHEEPPRRSRTPGARAPAATEQQPPAPLAVARPARYLGSFPVGGGEHAARVDTVSTHLHLMKENGRAVPVLVVIALTGVRVCNPDEQQSVRMSHALRRISYATCEASRALFAFVAREPRSEPAHHYCYAFETDTPEQAEELNSLVGDAFRMAFASQLQPSAPLWSKELSGECGGMGVRAPDSLPGLTHHYPPRSPAKCDIMGVTKLVNEVSPSSSEESNSPTEVNCYRRLGDRPPLMKRIAMGFSGALLQPSDDDSTPLVTDTPTTPTNIPLCLNGGYINEASEAEARTRESNRDVPAPPRRTENLHGDLDVDFRRCANIKNSSPVGACSRTTSSSSGASSCGGSHASGNNNVPRAEPELRQAPWFQQGIPREIALEVLSSQAVGAFLVRGSTTQAGCFALSVRVPRDFQPSGIAHYLILRTPKGYKIKGFTKEFTSLCALVTHHSVMPELLPVPLRLPRAPPPRAAARRDHADLDAVAPHAHAHIHAHAHHHLQNFLAQLDV